MTPYQYAANSPMIFIDVNGDSVWVTWQTGFWSFLGLGTEHKALYQNGKLHENGKEYTGNNDYAIKTLNALNTLKSETEGNMYVSQLEGSEYNYDVSEVRWYDSGNGFGFSDGRFEIKFDPNNQTGGIDVNGNDQRSPYIGLGHEIGHAYDTDLALHGSTITISGKNIFTTPWYTDPSSGQKILLLEKAACIRENKIRAEHGLPLRKYYDKPGPGVPTIF
jgi:hypothetical protein